MSDDEPLSIWIQALKKAHATSASHGGNAEVKCNTNCSQHNCIPSCQCIDPILPFEKTRSLWKTIESMEVFRQMPQTPHFKSLSMIKEISREGRAVALMVWFSDVVEKIPTLQPDGPRNIMEDVVETLDELEDNGFDVFVIRDRLMQLLSSKDKRDELESKEKEHTQQICLLREECGLPLSTRAEIDSKIADLESIVSGINESISYIDLEFKALAAAPWPLR
ncbi:DUF724 domain-containing protein 7-like [Apium graveolens]|uniref:DUF724 domain-containing protein 7-like n=1 Tax=Apium graveolens TaxID=4045 RepID=UPI003D7BD470